MSNSATAQAQHAILVRPRAAEKGLVLPHPQPLSLSPPGTFPPLYSHQPHNPHMHNPHMPLRGTTSWGLGSGQGVGSNMGEEAEDGIGEAAEYAGVKSLPSNVGDRVYLASLGKL